jgi:hypothetical protein
VESESHKLLKKKVAKKYSSQGYQTELERRIDNGLIVDVVAWNKEETIFIEVGALHGEDREEKLEQYCDKFIHLPQVDKPKHRDDEFTTVSFRKGFIEWLEENMKETHFSSNREFLKHLAIMEIESKEKCSKKDISAIAEKLEEMGYLES